MSRARCQIARHIVKYTTPRAVGNIMFFPPCIRILYLCLHFTYTFTFNRFSVFYPFFFQHLFILFAWNFFGDTFLFSILFFFSTNVED